MDYHTHRTLREALQCEECAQALPSVQVAVPEDFGSVAVALFGAGMLLGWIVAGVLA
jgi:hypothetical protein